MDEFGNDRKDTNRNETLELPTLQDMGQKERLFTKASKVIKTHTLYLDDSIKADTDINGLINTLRSAGKEDKLVVRICSPGGAVHVANRFKTIMKSDFHGRTTTILDPYGASACADLFLDGDVRIIYPYSYIMFHNFSAGAWGKGREILSRVGFYNNFFSKLMQRDYGPYFTKDEIEDLFKGADFYFDAEEMCRRGIATKVDVNGTLIDAKKYLKSLEPKATKKTVKSVKADKVAEKPVKKKPTRSTKQPKVKKEAKDESEQK